MIWHSGPESILAASFQTDGGISSKPADCLLFKFLSSLYTLSSVINPNLNRWQVRKGSVSWRIQVQFLRANDLALR